MTRYSRYVGSDLVINPVLGEVSAASLRYLHLAPFRELTRYRGPLKWRHLGQEALVLLVGLAISGGITYGLLLAFVLPISNVATAILALSWITLVVGWMPLYVLWSVPNVLIAIAMAGDGRYVILSEDLDEDGLRLWGRARESADMIADWPATTALPDLAAAQAALPERMWEIATGLARLRDATGADLRDLADDVGHQVEQLEEQAKAGARALPGHVR